MNKLFRKMAATAATVALLGSMFTTSIFAKSKDPKTTIINTSICDVDQSAHTNVGTLVLSGAFTGGNKAYKNVAFKGVTVKSGNASSTVGVGVSGGSNTATDPCCGCQTPAATALEDESNNNVTLVSFQGTFIDQSSSTNVLTGVVSVAATGGNSASSNVGGPVKVVSGDAASSVSVSVVGGSNTIN